MFVEMVHKRNSSTKMPLSLYDININTERENIWALVFTTSRRDAIKITRAKLQRDFIRALVRTRLLVFTTSQGPLFHHLGDSVSENITYADDETEYTISNQLWLEPVPNSTGNDMPINLWMGSVLKSQPSAQRTCLRSVNYFVSAPHLICDMSEQDAISEVYKQDARLRPIDSMEQVETHIILSRVKLKNKKGENAHIIQQETS